jgi:hypothetical protein
MQAGPMIGLLLRQRVTPPTSRMGRTVAGRDLGKRRNERGGYELIADILQCQRRFQSNAVILFSKTNDVAFQPLHEFERIGLVGVYSAWKSRNTAVFSKAVLTFSVFLVH